LLVLGGVAWLSGNAHVIELAAVLGACLMAFLIFNLRGWSGQPARIFMGDAGSLGLGFLIAIIALKLCSLPPAQGGAPPAVVIWACFVPLADGLSVIAARLLRGQGATAPGRDHLHHLLLARGMNPAQVVAIEAGGGLGLAVLAIAAWQLGAPEWLLVLGFVTLLALFYAGVSSQWSRLRRAHGQAVDESGLPDEVDIATDRVAG
jgi:UDP-GlcNAc:undecaprenyl-phosphate GlcNAc-1-phosphate transferase